jgi:hypothetical protein
MEMSSRIKANLPKRLSIKLLIKIVVSLKCSSTYNQVIKPKNIMIIQIIMEDI